MNLNERIANDLKEAMKNQDKFTLSVLRMLKSALQLESISLKHELTDQDVLSVIKRNVKMRKDSISEYQKYNQTEKINDLEKEIAILKVYLPEELSEEEILQIIEDAFLELKPSSIKDMGSVMKYLTQEIGNVADMSFVSKIVKDKLQN